MTTAPPPPPDASPSKQNGAPTLSTITTLSPLPHPLHPRRATDAAVESLRVLRQLGENATSSAVDYPYPTNTDYPLPPLPPIPVPTGKSRRRQAEPASRAPAPIESPQIPDESYLSSPLSLDQAISGHNEAHPNMKAVLHYNRSAMLVNLAGKGYAWFLLRTLGVDDGTHASDVRILGVRVFYSGETRPPPIHAAPPPGPSVVFGEHLKSLSLNVATLLYRLPHEVQLIDAACYRCGKHLADADGLPFNATGFIPPALARSVPNGSGESMDVDGKEGEEKAKIGESGDVEMKDVEKADAANSGQKKEEEEKEGKKDAGKEAAMREGKQEEENKDGRWVAWHASCRAP